jgi:hypothetical protein
MSQMLDDRLLLIKIFSFMLAMTITTAICSHVGITVLQVIPQLFNSTTVCHLQEAVNLLLVSMMLCANGAGNIGTAESLWHLQ